MNHLPPRSTSFVNDASHAVAAAAVLDEHLLAPEQHLPLVAQPAVDGVDLADTLRDLRAPLERKLDVHGALLFRGFDVAGDAGFERCARAFSNELYVDYGDLPHGAEGEAIYAATPYRRDRRILFHNEASHTECWPTKQFFYCAQPAATGGETPLVDCRLLYGALPRDLVDALERKGLRYVRNFIPALDVSWQTFFGTTDRAAVEARCARRGIDCEWIGRDRLRTSRRSVAILTHPSTGERVFFNQILLHHPAALDTETRHALELLYGEDGLPRNVSFGDGAPLPSSAVQSILTTCDALATSFAWRRGDLLVVDNMLVAHSRNPYTGERSIRVAMGDPMSGEPGHVE